MASISPLLVAPPPNLWTFSVATSNQKTKRHIYDGLSFCAILSPHSSNCTPPNSIHNYYANILPSCSPLNLNFFISQCLTASISVPPFLNSWQLGVCSQPCTEIAISNVSKGFLHQSELSSSYLTRPFCSIYRFWPCLPGSLVFSRILRYHFPLASQDSLWPLLFDSFPPFLQLWKYCYSPSFWPWCSFIHKHIFTDGLKSLLP